MKRRRKAKPIATLPESKCRVCGCIEALASPGSWAWAEPNLCWDCKGKLAVGVRTKRVTGKDAASGEREEAD